MFLRTFFTSLLILSAACGSDSDAPELSRSEARQLGGKSDLGIDLCERFAFYGDGICDHFCPEPDEDCVACPALVIESSCFSTDAQVCPEGTEALVDPDGCGCGCVPTDGLADCPSADTATYFSCFATVPEPCADDEAVVADPDGCGCYCEAVPTECPDPDVTEYVSCFAFAEQCDAGFTTEFIDGCGCVCRADEETCPSEDEVEYRSCFTTDAVPCPEGTRWNTDTTCGCYCEPEADSSGL